MKIGHLPYRFSFSFYDYPCVLSNRRGGFYLYIMIIRSHLTERFTNVPNDIIQNTKNPVRLAIHTYLLSMPLDWVVHKKQLYNHFDAGRKRIDDAFNELEEDGYIVRVQKVNDKGQFNGVQYIVYDFSVKEDPNYVIPNGAKPIDGKPTDGKTTTTNNYTIQNTNITKEEIDKASQNFGKRYVMDNQELLIQQAEDKYPNKDGSKAMEDFVYYISNTKGIRWKDYRLAFFKWIREDKFNKYNKTQSTKQPYNNINL